MLAALCLSCAMSVAAFAHNGINHGSDRSALESEQALQAIQQINADYDSRIKFLFVRSCTACHSQNVQLPWYHSIPGVRELLDRDVREARIHIDMTNDFPFAGHGTPLDDLIAIDEAMTDQSMPPLRYCLLHWSSCLTHEERNIVQRWARQGIARLSSPASI